MICWLRMNQRSIHNAFLSSCISCRQVNKKASELLFNYAIGNFLANTDFNEWNEVYILCCTSYYVIQCEHRYDDRKHS